MSDHENKVSSTDLFNIMSIMRFLSFGKNLLVLRPIESTAGSKLPSVWGQTICL